MAALPGDRPGTFLVHRHAFAVVPVPQLLPELRAPRSRNGAPSLLLMGGIDFDARQPRDTAEGTGPALDGRLFGPLAGTQNEVNELRPRFRKVFPKRQKRASGCFCTLSKGTSVLALGHPCA